MLRIRDLGFLLAPQAAGIEMRLRIHLSLRFTIFGGLSSKPSHSTLKRLRPRSIVATVVVVVVAAAALVMVLVMRVS